MSSKVLTVERFVGGIAVGDKEGIASSYRFGYGLNIHDEPSKFTALPSPIKVLGGNAGDTPAVGTTGLSGSVKWIVSGAPWIKAVFAYDENGYLYKEDQAGTWTVIRAVASSKGQGLSVLNNYLYYAQNGQIGRYGPLNGAPVFTDNWSTTVSASGSYSNTMNDTTTFGFAPIFNFSKGFVCGNGNYISYFDGTNFNANRIILPPQGTVMSLCRIEQYIMVATIGGTSTLDNEEGFIFAWDGSSVTFNFFNNIEQGSNNCIANYRNQPISINGTIGTIYIGIDPFVKVHQLPKIPLTSSCQVYPGAITSWKGKIYIGFAAPSDDRNFVRGLYAYGAKNNSYPDALSCDFLISTGNSGSTVSITACKGTGNSLYMAWRDGTTVGIDKITNSNAPQSTARIESLIFDDKRLPQDKAATTIRVDHSILRVGESVSIYTRTNRADDYTVARVVHSYTVGEDPNLAATTRWKPDSGTARFQEYEWAVTIGSTTTSPEVYGISLQYDDLADENSI